MTEGTPGRSPAGRPVLPGATVVLLGAAGVAVSGVPEEEDR